MIHNDTWGTICDDQWDMNGATVVCKQLGCGKVSAPRNACFGQGSEPILHQVVCSGTETALSLCKLNGFKNASCHGQATGVVCKGTLWFLLQYERIKTHKQILLCSICFS